MMLGDIKLIRCGKTSFLFSALISAMILSAVTLSNIEGWSVLSLAFAVLFLGVLFIYYRSIYFPRVLIGLGIFVFYNFLTLFFGGSPDYAVKVASSMLAGAVILIGLKKGVVSLEIIVLVFIIGGLLNIWAVRDQLFLFGNSDEDRVGGLLGNANGLALFLTFTAFIILSIPVRLPQIVRLTALFFMAFTVLFTGSRKGLLVILMTVMYVVVVYLFSLRERRMKQLVGLIFVFVLCIAGISFLLKYFINVGEMASHMAIFERTQEMLSGVYNIRYDMIAVGFDLWKNNPLWGWGAGQFQNLTVFQQYSHNNYIEILANYGLVGFVSYYSFYFLLIKKGLFRMARNGCTGSAAGLMLVIMFLIIEWGVVTIDEKSPYMFLSIAAFVIFDEDNISTGRRSIISSVVPGGLSSSDKAVFRDGTMA